MIKDDAGIYVSQIFPWIGQPCDYEKNAGLQLQ